MKRLIFIVIILITLQMSLFAQVKTKNTISGFVYDAANGEALIGANVYLEGTHLGSSTNLSGYYIIPRVPPGEYFLIGDYLGYRPFREKIKLIGGEERKMAITLAPEVIQVEEIVVSADSIRTVEKLFQKPISQIELSAIQIRQIPQVAEADLLRSLQTLPGILPLSDYSTALYIRGGTPDQNLYLVDGTDVYNPEHAFGIFSTFNTDAIKQVELSKGGFGAEYGGRLSSILNVTNLDGNREEFEGSASISLLSSKTTLQIPVGDFGAISGSIRRTYFDKTVAKTIDEIPDYYFYDGNIKGFFDIDKNNKLTISVFGGRDYLDLVFNKAASEQAGFQYDWGNKTGSVRWTKVFTPGLFSNFWITGSRFSSDFILDEVRLEERNFVSDITIKGNLEYHYSNQFSSKFGFEQKNLHTLYRESFPGGAVNVDYRPEHYVAYLQGNWKPTPVWNIEFGFRHNIFKSDTTFQNFSPRFSAKYRISDKINLTAAAGIYHQYLHRISRFFITDIWSVSNKYQKESTATHIILGYQQEVDDDYQLEIETFYKDYQNIYSLNPTFITELVVNTFNKNGDPVYTETKGLFNRGDGNSMGIECIFKKDVGVMTGWIGYSYSRTQYQIGGINQGRSFFPRHDRSSTINVVGNFDVRNTVRKWQGKPTHQDRSNWTLGINFVYSSGQPFTEPGSGYIVGSAPVAVQRYVEYAPTSINNIRFPAYARMDISLTYEKKFRNWSIAPYFQVFNVGNRKNVWFVNYEYSNGIPTVKEQYMLPILPTLGFNLTF